MLGEGDRLAVLGITDLSDFFGGAVIIDSIAAFVWLIFQSLLDVIFHFVNAVNIRFQSCELELAFARGSVQVEVTRVVEVHDWVLVGASFELGSRECIRDLIFPVEEPSVVTFQDFVLDIEDIVFICKISFQISRCQSVFKIVQIRLEIRIGVGTVPLESLVDLLEEGIILKISVGDHLDG